MNDDGNSNNTILPIQYGGIVLMCRVTKRHEKTKPYTYKSNHHGGIVLVGGFLNRVTH